MNNYSPQHLIAGIVFFAILLLGGAQLAHAQLGTNILNEVNSIGSIAGFKPQNAQLGLPYQIGVLIRGIMGLLGVIFLILVVYAGYKWMLAHGEPGEVKTAQQLLLHSIIGLVITVSAYAISTFVINAIRAAAT